MRADGAFTEEVAEGPVDLAGRGAVATEEGAVIAMDGLGLTRDFDVMVQECLEGLAGRLPAAHPDRGDLHHMDRREQTRGLGVDQGPLGRATHR